MNTTTAFLYCISQQQRILQAHHHIIQNVWRWSCTLFYTTIVFSSHLSNIIILVIFFLLFLDITFSFGETNYLTTILGITSYLTLCGLAFFLALFSEVLLNSFKKETGAWISYISHAFLTLSLYLMCIYPDKWYNICVCYIPLHHHHFVDHHHQLRRHLALTTHYIHFFYQKLASCPLSPSSFHHHLYYCKVGQYRSMTCFPFFMSALTLAWGKLDILTSS